jgi:hypothetical protein
LLSQGLNRANEQLRAELDSSRAATHAELERLRDRLSAAEAKAAAEAEAAAALVRAMHEQTSNHLRLQQEMDAKMRLMRDALAKAMREKEEAKAEADGVWQRCGEAEDQLQCVQTERSESTAAMEEEKRTAAQRASEAEKLRKKLDVWPPGLPPYLRLSRYSWAGVNVRACGWCERTTPALIRSCGTTRYEPTQRKTQKLAQAEERETKREADLALLIECNKQLEAEFKQMSDQLELYESERENIANEAQQRVNSLQAELDDVRRTAAAAEQANGAWVWPTQWRWPLHIHRELSASRAGGDRALIHARLSTRTLTELSIG